jgi:enoyl-CoA hydratase
MKVTIENYIANVAFDNPKKSNALKIADWEAMKATFEELDDNPKVRVIILSGEGKNFCAGIDISALMQLQQFKEKCDGRSREKLRKFILHLQSTVTAIEKCGKPVIAAIHGACIGGAVDIIAACDMRYCSADAYYSIREIDLGLVADLGTMQRLPTILNPGFMAELAFTGRNVSADEAARIGLVNQSFETQEAMHEYVQNIAKTIASKSPLVVRGTKHILLQQRDNSVENGLEYMATWNAGFLFSNDLMECFQAFMQKRKAEFED